MKKYCKECKEEKEFILSGYNRQYGFVYRCSKCNLKVRLNQLKNNQEKSNKGHDKATELYYNSYETKE